MDTDVIEAERAVAVVESPSTALFAGSTPSDVAKRMKDTAVALKEIVEAAHGSDGRSLIMKIPGVNGSYVRCEGWTTLGAMLSVFPVNVWTRPLPENKGYEARVEARTLSGAVVGAAEAMCSRDEKRWADADNYAIRSMAQTRATSKALRMPLGFVMTLAGYEATPAEEMDGIGKQHGRVPKCKLHQLDMRFIKAGKSKGGKEYAAFWGCPNRDCKTTVADDTWQAHLQRQDVEAQTEPEPYDPDDVPDEVSESKEIPPVVIGDSTMAQKKAIRGLLNKVDAVPAAAKKAFYEGMLRKYPKCRGTDGKVHLTPLDKAEAEDVINTAGAFLREDA